MEEGRGRDDSPMSVLKGSQVSNPSRSWRGFSPFPEGLYSFPVNLPILERLRVRDRFLRIHTFPKIPSFIFHFPFRQTLSILLVWHDMSSLS